MITSSFAFWEPDFFTLTLLSGVLVLLICVQILVRLD